MSHKKTKKDWAFQKKRMVSFSYLTTNFGNNLEQSLSLRLMMMLPMSTNPVKMSRSKVATLEFIFTKKENIHSK